MARPGTLDPDTRHGDAQRVHLSSPPVEVARVERFMVKRVTSPATGLKATMADVAAATGLSWVTVARAMSAPHLVALKSRERIQAAIVELGYSPNLSARSLVSRATKIVGVIVPTIQNSLYADTMEGLTDVLLPAGYQLLLGHSAFDDDREDAVIQSILGRRPDAIVLTQGCRRPELRERLLQASIHVMEVWGLSPQPIDMAVGYDEAQAARLLADYLLDRGYDHFAYVTRPLQRFGFAQERWDGFQSAIRQRSSRSKVLLLEYEGDPARGCDAVNLVRSQHPDVQVLFCASSLFAVGALLECARRSIEVPRELAVVGIGDVQLAALTHPRLTVVSNRARDIGRRAGELIVARLQGGASVPQVVDLGVELIERESA
ncbi:MAG: LacI family DNA-binding transcriptional regulator [Pseudomonadota bacterium]|nr:LacI family DNA-binding transcriptional regulator [Pseudomonadota bacterium]